MQYIQSFQGSHAIRVQGTETVDHGVPRLEERQLTCVALRSGRTGSLPAETTAPP